MAKFIHSNKQNFLGFDVLRIWKSLKRKVGKRCGCKSPYSLKDCLNLRFEIGFSQYDMKHNKIYNNLDKKTIYLLNQNRPIVKNGKWNSLMFPKIRNLDFLIKSYNAHFNKKYTMKELENKPLSLWQTNIYPVKIYEKESNSSKNW